jgi:hypothetical protein
MPKRAKKFAPLVKLFPQEAQLFIGFIYSINLALVQNFSTALYRPDFLATRFSNAVVTSSRL